MGNALMKEELKQDAIQLDVRDALSAALLRAEKVPAADTILDTISAEEWKKMDCKDENVIVFDPE